MRSYYPVLLALWLVSLSAAICYAIWYLSVAIPVILDMSGNG